MNFIQHSAFAIQHFLMLPALVHRV